MVKGLVLLEHQNALFVVFGAIILFGAYLRIACIPLMFTLLYVPYVLFELRKRRVRSQEAFAMADFYRELGNERPSKQLDELWWQEFEKL